MKQRMLEEVAKSLLKKIRNQRKLDPVVFQSSCQTFIEIMRMLQEPGPSTDQLKDMRNDLNRVLSRLEMVE